MSQERTSKTAKPGGFEMICNPKSDSQSPSARCHHPSLIARWLTLFALCAFPFAVATAQSATATLSGTVTDPNNAVVPGAHVTATNNGTGLKREATTNGSGIFTIPLLPPSTYTVLVENQGFTPAEIKDVTLNVGDNVALNIQMKIGHVGATVNVTSEASLINESPAVGTVVDRQFAANIPLNGRSFQSLITLTPGVVLTPNPNGGFNYDGQFSVNGQRPTANAFSVDGVSANFGAAPNKGPGTQTGGNNPGLTAFGTTQSLASVDALQEFKVQTSSYSAEYGRQPGGQISIVTRSGTNEFHGSIFDYLRNDKFDANDWFANANKQPRPPERQNDFGGTFSGPVLLPGYNGRNRTFFFFSYEGLRLRLPTFTLTNVPSLSLRQQGPAGVQPILNAFPLPNGRDLGNGLAEFSASYSNPSSLNATSIRLDHTINSKLTLFGRYNQAPSKSAQRSTGNLNLINSNEIGTKTLTFGLTATLSPQLINELRVNYSDNPGFNSLTQDNFAGATRIPRGVLIPSQYDSISAQGAAVFFLPGRTSSSRPLVNFVDQGITSQRQFNLVNNISYGVGAHQFKFGIDFRRLTPIFNVNPYATEFDFDVLTDVTNSRPDFVIVQAGIPAKPLYVNFSAFAHDTWKPSRRLTLDFGLRWEVNPPPGEANGNLPLAVTEISNLSTMQLAPRGTKLWKTTYNNFAPRIGMAYQLRQQPGRETVIRGGFGVFYDTGNDFSAFQFAVFPFNVTVLPGPITLPFNPSLIAPPAIPAQQSTITPPYGTLYAFDPNLKLPYTLQWNLTTEQSLGRSQVITLSYVGASGKRLLQRKQLSLATINPLFRTVNLTTNSATSDYEALQAQFQRRLSRGLQAVASYTWSHAIDDDSASYTSRLALRGNASFDVRHIFAAAVTYDIPSPKRLGVADAIFSRWSFDTTAHAQSALPVDPIARTFTNPADGTVINVRPDLIGGVPIYINDPTVPGGKKINRAAFAVPVAGQSGTLGRNVLRGLPAWQLDFALRRQFRLTEKLNLQFRAEAFNIFNHPNFGTIQTSLTAANFGQATNMLNRQLGSLSQLYQIGGPRSLQFALRLQY
jgi:Carboxypeptidase regulatory-like domain